jgi:uncharacterized OB-fold protein
MTQHGKGKRRVPLFEDMLALPDSPTEKARLIGSRCRSCNEVFFPIRHYCAGCTSADMEEMRLGPKGVIHTYTISRATPPGSIMKAPYGIAQIALPEGVLVTAVLADCDLEALDIGQKVELVVEKLREDEDGNEVVSFKFKPL